MVGGNDNDGISHDKIEGKTCGNVYVELGWVSGHEWMRKKTGFSITRIGRGCS